jgi:hypothetical protein
LRLPLVSRDAQQDSAEYPKEIRTLDPELVWRAEHVATERVGKMIFFPSSRLPVFM